MNKKKIKLHIFKINYNSLYFYLIIFKLFYFCTTNFKNLIVPILNNYDITYILEKIILKKNIKHFFKQIATIKIQETIFFKYINYINNYINHTLSVGIFKATFIFNLHKYIIDNFPTYRQIKKLIPSPTTNYLELINQRSLIQTIKSNNTTTTFILPNALLLEGLKSIETIFEFLPSKYCMASTMPTLGLVLKIYSLEVPIQALLKNLHISITYNSLSSPLLYIKSLGTLVSGGDLLIIGDFNPHQVVTSCHTSLIVSMTLYKTVKATSIIAYNLLLESLLKQYKYQGISLPAFVFEIIIKRMVSYVKIINVGDTMFQIGDILTYTLINLINQSFIYHGFSSILYKPVLMGISKISISHSGLLASISFQETLKSLSSLVVVNQIDWLLDLKSKVIISDLLGIGTGWYKHYNKILR